MKQQFSSFVIRWVLNSFGLWIAVRLLGSGYSETVVDASVGIFLLAGLVFSCFNAIIRPIVIILSLPAILFTLGLFILVVNGLMVYLSLMLVPGLSMTFLNSIFAGMILSLINYIVSSTLELQIINKRENKL